MRHVLAIPILFLVLSLVSRVGAQANCKPVPLDTPTRWGGNEAILVDLRDRPVRVARGRTLFGGESEPLPDVLLQVYRRKHLDSLYQTPQPGDPLPVAACITGKDGGFRFDLPNGEYELRASVGPGMDVTHTYFVIRHGLVRSRPIVIAIHLGT